MTADSHNPEKDFVDELTSQWFDSESLDSKVDELPKKTDETFTAEQLKRANELRLVHSLLLQLADREAAAKEHRVQRVMQNIDDAKQMPEMFRRIAQPFIRYGIAAMIIIAAAILFTKMPSNTAVAAIDQIIVAIDQAKDRTYALSFEREDRRQDRPPMPRGKDRRSDLDGATLYLRGSNQHVLYRSTASGKFLINGSDGVTSWLIRPDKPLLTSSDPQAFPIPIPDELANIFSLDLKSTLLHIREHYTIKHLEEVVDEKQSNEMLHYLDARKITREFEGPKNIEIWANAQTGLLLRIEFAKIHLQDDPHPKRLIIDLIDQEQLSDDWFTHQAHYQLKREN